MTKKPRNLLSHGGGVDPDDLDEDAPPQARAAAANYWIEHIMKSMEQTKNPLHWWEALRVCALFKTPMQPDLADYVLRAADALLAGVGNVNPTQAPKFIAE